DYRHRRDLAKCVCVIPHDQHTVVRGGWQGKPINQQLRLDYLIQDFCEIRSVMAHGYNSLIHNSNPLPALNVAFRCGNVIYQGSKLASTRTARSDTFPLCGRSAWMGSPYFTTQ